MPVLSADLDLDLIATTQRELGRGRYTDISFTDRRYWAMPRILKDPEDQRSGTSCQWDVKVSTSGAFRMTGLYDTVSANQIDMMKQANVDWRYARTNYSIDDREISMNREPARIVNLVKVKRYDAFLSAAIGLERQIWTQITDSSNNEDILSIPTWLQKNSGATPGFNGGNPAAFPSGLGGLSSSIYPNWSNWTFSWSQISAGDLIKKVRQAIKYTDFMSPVPKSEQSPDFNTGNDYAHYVPYSTLSELEIALTKQNQNLGNDLAAKDGMVTMRRNPVEDVPFLDADSDIPWYGINWGVFKARTISDEFGKEMPPMRKGDQPRVILTNIYWMLQLICYDRRRHFVGIKV